MSKKIALGILRFVSILFLIFETRMRKKNPAKCFKIRKDIFFNISKIDEQKNCSRNFKIRKYAFLIFEKGMSKKILPGDLRFVSMLFLKF